MVGANTKGQLGQNDLTHRSSPVQVPGQWSKFSMGGFHALATKTDGTLWAVGEADYGQLGDNTNVNKSSPVQIGSDTTWSDINCGQQASYAKKTDGTFWTWGDNIEVGNLGLNDNIKRSSPTQIPGTTWSKA